MKTTTTIATTIIAAGEVEEDTEEDEPIRIFNQPALDVGYDTQSSAASTFFLFLAPKGWVPDEAKVALAQKNLQDPKIREEIEDIRKGFASMRINDAKRTDKKNKEDKSLI